MPQNKPYIAPKDPAGSILYKAAAVWSNPNVIDMPKIGVAAPDPAAAQILADWINSL